MKIRKGFVSNSSSSSFCIYGACLSTSEMIVVLKKWGEEEDLGDCGSYELAEMIESKLTNVRCYCGPYDDGAYIGRSWDSVKDDETGLQFKTSIEEQITKMSPILKCHTYEEAWHD